MSSPERRGPPRPLGRRDQRDGGLHARVVDALGQEVVNGRLAPGSVLYADDLVERFEVSRSVVREAVRTLSSIGLVESRRQVGTRVLPRTHWNLLDPRVVTWRGRGTEYLVQQRELLELRLGVETTAAELAVDRIDDAGAAELLQHAQEMRECLLARDSARFFEADAQFHRVLVEGSGNAIIAHFADTITAVLEARSVDHRPAMARMLLQAVDLHLELAHAVGARDRTSAAAAAYAIVRSTLTEFEELDVEPIAAGSDEPE